jgi:hypothetical protein
VQTYPAPVTTSQDETSDGPKPGKASAATLLVQLAEDDYELGCTSDGEPYGIPRCGAPIIRQLRGGRGSLRAELSRAFYAEYGSAPSQSALADALMVLEGKAQHEVTPVDLHLRVAKDDGVLVVDLGDETGRAIEVTGTGWTVADTTKVRFRRTVLTAPLPTPVAGGSFEPLWSALNVQEQYRPVVLGVLVAALLPDIPHPIVLITGEHGTGKTTATNRLASVVDPSTVGPRKPPRDLESWTTAAAASWVVALDNLSGMSDWLSDALCRASTGDGEVRRRLYTDGDLAVFKFRRQLIVNGIDLGALRGDLSDRLVHLALERIPDKSRRTDEAMAGQWRDAHPKVLGALLDLTAKVLGKLPDVKLESMPRMADFAKVLTAVDAVLGTEGMAVYLRLRREQAEDIATSDPVIIQLAECVTGELVATSAQLLTVIHPIGVDDRSLPKDWPANPRELTGHMKRIAPVLRQLGWTVIEYGKGRGPGSARDQRQVRWSLTPPPPPNEDEDPDTGRRSAKDATDATTRHDHASSQVNGHMVSVASCVANPSQQPGDATPSRHAMRRDTVATLDATGTKPMLTSVNGDHVASVASVAPNADLLCMTCHRVQRTSLVAGQCRRCHFARRAS